MKIKGKKIFLTGGYGFIGSALCERLVKDNKLIIFDNERRNALKYTNLLSNKNITAVTGDILDKSSFSETIHKHKPDIVIHLAAMAGVSDYFRHPKKTMEVNMIGTYNVLESVKDLKLEKFLNFSTSEVYGPFIFRAKENEPTTQGEVKMSRWTYSVSKLAAEHLCFAYQKQYNLPLVSVRPFNIYGPGQVGEGAIKIFAPLAMKNKEISVTGDGNQIRAWCYIDDMADAVIMILENNNVIGEVFNIGNPRGTITILGLVEKIINLTGSSSKIKFIPHPNEDIVLRVPDIKKAEKLLGFRPKVDFDEGLARTIEWYKKVKLSGEEI
ncbi:MAG: NAD-dependent epimerase/dehydratase family protein [Elusimicrobia bacterium]|nr:NAD-dependent epimerase/dehydratase family protein [Elusimicrobiota bacterium]